jgi:hypothetical protein
VFYQLPEHAAFYPELLNLIEPGDNSCLVRAHSHANKHKHKRTMLLQPSFDRLLTCSHILTLLFYLHLQVLFNKYDAFALERVVGSERSAKLLKSDKDVHMFC